MFRFANPDYLYLLIILPILVAYHIFTTINKRKRLKLMGDMSLLSTLMPLYSSKRQEFKFYLIISALAFCTLLLARPQFGSKLETDKRKGVEVIIALDVSKSMMAKDLSPNRLERSKRLVTKLIDDMSNDKVGLIVFAGESFTQIPITSDYISAKMFMPSISPSLVPVQGTAIGSAIDLAMSSFNSKSKTSRTIIVITDGENHEDDAVEAAKEAASKGIIVNVIGVGKLEGSPIPLDNSEVSFKSDKAGNIVISKLNEAMCQEIAKAGKGIYTHADNTNRALEDIEKKIDKMSKDDVESNIYSEYSEQFQAIAFLIFLLLIIEIFILERKSKNKWYGKIKLF